MVNQNAQPYVTPTVPNWQRYGNNRSIMPNIEMQILNIEIFW